MAIPSGAIVSGAIGSIARALSVSMASKVFRSAFVRVRLRVRVRVRMRVGLGLGSVAAPWSYYPP